MAKAMPMIDIDERQVLHKLNQALKSRDFPLSLILTGAYWPLMLNPGAVKRTAKAIAETLFTPSQK